MREHHPPVELRVQCVDKGRPGCSEVESWESDPAVQPAAVDKILSSPLLSPLLEPASVAHRSSSLGLPHPESTSSSPTTSSRSRQLVNGRLAEHRGLEDRAFCIDHYRVKEPWRGPRHADRISARPETSVTWRASVGKVPPAIAAVSHRHSGRLVEDEHRLDDRARFSVGGRPLDIGKRIVPDQLLQG